MNTKVSRPGRVLVVDDEPDICEALTVALAADGLTVTSAGSGAEARELARNDRPDLLVTDVRLPDCTGMELIRALRDEFAELPVVIITGYGDAATFSEASKTHPVELLNKPVDLGRLREAVCCELQRQEQHRRTARRHLQVRELARHVQKRRRTAARAMAATCDDLTATCRGLQDRLDRQDALIRYQTDLLGSANDDDTFAQLFRLFVHRSGPVFGVAMLCDEDAELQIVGRFGVPVPDGVEFCRSLAMAGVDTVLESPDVHVIDAMDHIEMFPQNIHKLLVGVTVMLVPLMIAPGRMIGLVALYRKGEQPFIDDDVDMARLISLPTAAAVQNT